MVFRVVSILLFLSFSSIGALAQRTCGVERYDHFTVSQSRPTLNKRGESETEPVKIPVVFHVVYNKGEQNLSRRQIYSQIQVLNEDFNRNNPDTGNTPGIFKKVAADCNIRFCLAKETPKGGTTNGITRHFTQHHKFGLQDSIKFDSLGGKDGWPSDQYLNIWVGPLRSGLSGYSSGPQTKGPLDGIVIHYKRVGRIGNVEYPYNGGRSLTHEVGHWLGVAHHWGLSCRDADTLEDTPVQKDPNYGCPGYPLANCNNSAGGQMFMNYMDYTVDHCMNLFTKDQKKVMRQTLKQERQTFLKNDLASVRCHLTVPKKTIQISPNPAKRFVSIDLSNFGNIADLKVALTNMQGKTFRKREFSTLRKTVKFNILSIPTGVYLIKVKHDAKIHLKKLVIR